MKKALLYFILIFSSFSSFSQDFSSCFNGVKDSLEDGVDCFKNTHTRERLLCSVCNGDMKIDFNGRIYETGVIRTTTVENESPFIFIDKSSTTTLITASFYTDGDRTSGFSINFTILKRNFKPGSYKLKSFTKSPFGFFIQYHKSNAFLYPHKLKEGVFDVIDVDNVERKITGKIKFEAQTADGTPINFVGTFSNISY